MVPTSLARGKMICDRAEQSKKIGMMGKRQEQTLTDGYRN